MCAGPQRPPARVISPERLETSLDAVRTRDGIARHVRSRERRMRKTATTSSRSRGAVCGPGQSASSGDRCATGNSRSGGASDRGGDFRADLHLALASYNAGENRVRRWLAARRDLPHDEFIDDIPFPETRTYVKKILGAAENYRRICGSSAKLVIDPNRPIPSLTSRTATSHPESPVRDVPATKRSIPAKPRQSAGS